MNRISKREVLIPQKIESFLQELNPDDVGVQNFGKWVVVFEGFTDMCWEDAEQKNKTIESLEKEILKDWEGRYHLGKPLAFGFMNGGTFGEDDVFYAIYINKTKKEIVYK